MGESDEAELVVAGGAAGDAFEAKHPRDVAAAEPAVRAVPAREPHG